MRAQKSDIKNQTGRRPLKNLILTNQYQHCIRRQSGNNHCRISGSFQDFRRILFICRYYNLPFVFLIITVFYLIFRFKKRKSQTRKQEKTRENGRKNEI